MLVLENWSLSDSRAYSKFESLGSTPFFKPLCSKLGCPSPNKVCQLLFVKGVVTANHWLKNAYAYFSSALRPLLGETRGVHGRCINWYRGKVDCLVIVVYELNGGHSEYDVSNRGSQLVVFLLLKRENFININKHHSNYDYSSLRSHPQGSFETYYSN